MLSPALLALLLILFVVLLAPTGRLRRSGWPAQAAATYLVVMILLGLLVVELPGPARFLVPILVLAYLAPFVVDRIGLGRWRARRSSAVTVERPEVKQVYGPARDVEADRPKAPADVDERPSSRTP